MNSYISTSTSTSSSTGHIDRADRADRGIDPAGYVSTGLAATIPTGYVSPATSRGAGSYVATEWVTAA